MDQDAVVTQLMTEIKNLRLHISNTGKTPAEAMLSLVEKKRKSLQSGKKSGAMSADQQRILRKLMQCLSEEADMLNGISAVEALPVLKKDFDVQSKALKKQAETVSRRMDNMFVFSESVFGEGQELLIIVTELTANKGTAAFIGKIRLREILQAQQRLAVV